MTQKAANGRTRQTIRNSATDCNQDKMPRHQAAGHPAMWSPLALAWCKHRSVEKTNAVIIGPTE
jgi:hypothetical protein